MSPGIRTVTVTSGGTAATCAVSVLPAGSPGGSVLCSPSSQTGVVGQQVSFSASGGNGSYVWSASDLTITNPNGATFNATYNAAGLHTLTVASGGATSSCSVNVLSTPGLPDTGFAPVE
jgi:hypothetical protein